MEVSSATGTTTTAASNDLATLSNDFDEFLNLLTTQLKNQDPLSPMDSTEFTNQLVMFSQVEQQIKANDTLENLLTMQTLNLTALGVSFIGKDVEVAGDTFITADAGASVAMSYAMPESASSATISILDEDGNVVYSQAAELSSGRHDFVWNGKDNSGNPAAAGTFEVRIGATGTEGKSLNVTTYVPGHVNGLESADDGSLMLVIGDEKISITDVRKIFEPTI